jgi:hypothetical protein
MVLEALQELGEGRWVPWEAVAGFIRTDSRTAGLSRLIERWAARSGIEPMTPGEVAHRIALESLHILGAVDLGDIDDEDSSIGPTLRITPRGRAYLGFSDAMKNVAPSQFLDTQALRIGGAARIGEVLALAPFVEIGRVSGHLDVVVTQAALSRALSAGCEPDWVQARLLALAPLPDPISHLLAQASTVLGRAEFVGSEGFLWVDDPELREMLRTRRQTADLFLDPSPPGGLLLAAGADIERVSRRCRALGVEVLVSGRAYRTRSTAPPNRLSVLPNPEPVSKSPRATARKVSGTRRRASTAQLHAAKLQAGKRTR